MNDAGHIEGVNTATLMIVNVTVTDWGVYICEASNIVNNATSNGATLHGKCMCTYVHVYVCVCVCVCVFVHVSRAVLKMRFLSTYVNISQYVFV